MIKNISNLGDTALYCDFGSEVNQEINSKVIQYFKNIKEKEKGTKEKDQVKKEDKTKK